MHINKGDFDGNVLHSTKVYAQNTHAQGSGTQTKKKGMCMFEQHTVQETAEDSNELCELRLQDITVRLIWPQFAPPDDQISDQIIW